jgi:hypothetical protein
VDDGGQHVAGPAGGVQVPRAVVPRGVPGNRLAVDRAGDDAADERAAVGAAVADGDGVGGMHVGLTTKETGNERRNETGAGAG